MAHWRRCTVLEKRLTEQYFLERLKTYIELLRLMWVSILAVGGGAIGFIITTIYKVYPIVKTKMRVF